MAAGWNKGKKHSVETKQRISESIKRNHPMHGPNREKMICGAAKDERQAQD